MSQAKSVMKPDDFNNVKRNLQKGLGTLNNAAKLSEVEQLVFVTNSPNPFNDATTMFKFSSPLNMASFSELPENCKQVIDEICTEKGYDFDKKILSVCVMQFHGENEDERYKVLSQLTAEFLNSLGIYKIPTTQLLTLWQHSFAVNATQQSTAITKERMVWPVIAILCEVSEEDAELQDYDEHDIEEIVHKYRNVINNNSERFAFVSRVLSDYNDYAQELKPRERTQKFINDKWNNYEDCFDLKSADQQTREMVIRLTVANVLRSRKVITEVKGKVRL